MWQRSRRVGWSWSGRIPGAVALRTSGVCWLQTRPEIGELGFSDFQVRRDHAIRRHWEMVLFAFSFCWWEYTNTQQEEHERTFTGGPQPPDIKNVAAEEAAGKKEHNEEREIPPSWLVALRRVRGWLDPWVMLWRYWRAWSKAPPPPQLQALLDTVGKGHSLDVYVPV